MDPEIRNISIDTINRFVKKEEKRVEQLIEEKNQEIDVILNILNTLLVFQTPESLELYEKLCNYFYEVDPKRAEIAEEELIELKEEIKTQKKEHY